MFYTRSLLYSYTEMSLSTFIKLLNKAIKFAIARPIQRYNIENRSKKYLGPDAKNFMPAPRAIGAMSQIDKPVQYPHLQSGFKSMRQKRLEASKSMGTSMVPSETEKINSILTKSFSETELDDDLVIKAASRLAVNKSVKIIEDKSEYAALLKDSSESDMTALGEPKKGRPLPTSVNLPLQDPASIWEIKKTPPGRLNLNMLQELMIHKLSDGEYWTSQRLAEHYNIREDYAEKLTKYVKQIRMIIPPTVAKNLDYLNRDNEAYKATKDIIYYVDNSLRTEYDRKYDDTFDPENDQLDESVKKVLAPPDSQPRPYLIDTQNRRLKQLVAPKPIKKLPQ